MKSTIQTLCIIFSVLLLGFLQAQGGAKIRSDMKKAQVLPSPTNGIGVGLNNGIIASMRSYQRVAPYDTFTGQFKTTPTTNALINLNFPNQNATNGAINYVQGVGMFALLGIILILLTIIWIFAFIGFCIYGCAVKCCCPIEREKDDPRNFKLRINICRIVILVYVVFTMIFCLLPWTILTWQANQDLSSLYDNTVDQSTVIQNYVYKGLTIDSNVTTLLNSVQDGINNVPPIIISILPIDNMTQCFNSVVRAMPNATVMLDFIIQARKAIDALPNLRSIESSFLNVPANLSTVQKNALVPMNNSFVNVQTALYNITTSMTNLLAQLAIANPLYTVDIASNIVTAQALMNELNVNITDTNLQILYTSLTNTAVLNTADPKQIAANLTRFANSVQILQNTDLTGLASNLALMSSLKNNVSATIMKKSIDDIITYNTSANWALAQASITTYNTSLSGVFGNINKMMAELKNMSYAVSLFPSPNILTDEVNKFSSVLGNLTCISGVLDSIRVINETIIQFPSSVSASINGFGNVQTQVTSVNLTAIPTSQLTSITNSTLSVQPQINQISTNFSNTIGALNTVQLSKDALTANTNYNTLLAKFNANSIRNDMYQFANNQSNLIDYTTQSTWVGSIRVAASNVDLSATRARANQLASASTNPCTVAECPVTAYATVAGYVNSIRTACNSLTGRGNSPSLVSNMGTSRVQVTTLPNITKDYQTTQNTFTGSNVTIPTVTADTLAVLVDIVVQNVSLYLLQQLPYGDVTPILQPVQTQINDAYPQLDKATSLVKDYQTQVDNVQKSTPATYLTSIVNSFSSVGNISGISSQVNGYIQPTLNTINASVNSVISTRNTISGYVYEYDGIRLLICALLILVPIFIPLLSTCVICCPRLPCSLLIYAFVAILVSLISYIFVAVLLPANVLVNDTCDNVSKYAYTAATQLGGSELNKNVSFTTTVVGLNFTVSFNPVDIIPAYLSSSGCPNGTDPVNTIFTQVKNQLGGLSKAFGDIAGQQLANQGFVLLPGGYSLIDRITGPVIGNASLFVDGIAGLVGCSSLNPLIMQSKDIVCYNGSNALATLDLSFLLLGIIFSFASVFACVSYCFMVCNKVVENKALGLDPDYTIVSPYGEAAVVSPNVGGVDETKRYTIDEDNNNFFAPIENDANY